MRDLLRLLPFLRPYRWRLAAVALLVAAGVALGLAWPLYARYVVDQVLSAGRGDRLALAAAGLAGLALAGLLVGAGGRVLYLVTAARLLTDMRLHLFRHVLGLPSSRLTRTRRGDLATRLHQDLAEAQRALTDGIMQVAVTVLGLVAALGLMLWLDWRLTLATLALAPLVLGAAAGFRGAVARAARRVRDDSADMLSFLVEGLDRVRLVQAWAEESREAGRYRGVIERFMGDLLSFQWVSMAAAGAPAAVLALAGLVVFLWGGSRVVEGTMTLGTLLAYGAYQVRFFAPLQDLVRTVVALARAGASVRRVVELLDLPSAPLPPEGPRASAAAPLLAFESVEFAYDAGRPVLRGVSLTVPPGRVVAVVGPNGAGKSTLASLLLKLEEPASGRILFDGVDLREVPADRARRALTLVPSDPMLMHGTLEENLRWGDPRASLAEQREAARRAGLLEWIESLPEGWATRVGERGLALSDGQRQRLALARALLRGAPVLVLDEATSAVDLLAEEALWDALREGPAPSSILVLAHRMASVRRADLVVALEEGRVVQEGRPEDLASRPGLYARLVAAGRSE